MARQDLERVFVLSLHFLGPTRVERDGEVMGLPPSRKTRALLAYLALTGRPHRRERLCSLLWDIPDDPRGALRWSLSRIRALVDEPDLRRIVADRDTVRFDAHGALIDVLNLRWASGGGLGTIPTEDLEAVATGSDGELLEGEEFPEHHAFHSWCIAEREEARAARVRVLSALVKRLGSKPRKALPHARALVELQSDREEAWAALVELLASAGRHREAEEQCELARRVLQEAGAPISGPLNRASPNVRQPSSGSHSTSFEPDRAVGDEADKPRAHSSRVGTSLSTGEALAPTTDSPLLLKPSIAVLPFTSLGSDPADEWFSDGLTEDLITDLSRQAGLFVIARNSSFAYKGKSADVRQIAIDLGVRFLLEGSARRAAGRVRINVQLIDAVGGKHLWAERYDRTLEDVFAVQDEVTGSIVSSLMGRLIAPKPRKRPESLEAHDLCTRARVLTEESPQTAREAYLLLSRATELDPSYAEAHGLLAYNRWLAWVHFGEPEEVNRPLAVELARHAVALDPDDAGCRYFLGTILAYEKRWEESDAEFAAALQRDANHADTWAALSDMSVLGGKTKEGLEQIKRALRLNPHPACWYFCHLGQAQYAARDYVSAVETLRREETYRTNSRRFLAASLAQLGRLEEARREVDLFLVSHPHFTISYWVSSQPLRDPATLEHFVEGFRKAGLPE